MKQRIPTLDEFINESFLDSTKWGKYAESYLMYPDIKDKKEVSEFVHYWNLNPIINDIWEYASKTLNVFPDKIVAFKNNKCGIRYGVGSSKIIEIEVNEKDATLYLFFLNYIPSKRTFDNKLLRTAKFSYKAFKEMYQ